MALNPQRIAVALASTGAAALAAGIGWIHPPSGLIAAGVELLAGGYLVAYFGKGAR